MFLTYIVPLSILIPILIGLFNYKNLQTSGKFVFYYLVASGLINLAAIVLVAFRMTNLPLLHLYTIVEAVLLLSYFRTIFTNHLIRKFLLYIIIIFPLLCIINFTFIQSIFTFNTYTRPLEAILITFFCLLYLYKSGFTENWINKQTSWFNMGILLYFPVVCIIFILSNYMVFVSKNKELNLMIWQFHAIMSMVMYLAMAKGFSLTKTDG
ncbi:hypothetical protein [Pedobacter cryotolerans]|uniref:Uncharacterized protein n=1 Tax=Pedobacter cryotolerans TaxID=2571270 RepID=A0A4U1C752_9SPHI|nr:hypothetical protein [Pedobacter cryotolerans]TKC01264.1 hypothetical protein FA045_08455 [Pedobacter cryotolerans]